MLCLIILSIVSFMVTKHTRFNYAYLPCFAFNLTLESTFIMGFNSQSTSSRLATTKLYFNVFPYPSKSVPFSILIVANYIELHLRKINTQNVISRSSRTNLYNYFQSSPHLGHFTWFSSQFLRGFWSLNKSKPNLLIDFKWNHSKLI